MNQLDLTWLGLALSRPRKKEFAKWRFLLICLPACIRKELLLFPFLFLLQTINQKLLTATKRATSSTFTIFISILAPATLFCQIMLFAVIWKARRFKIVIIRANIWANTNMAGKGRESQSEKKRGSGFRAILFDWLEDKQSVGLFWTCRKEQMSAKNLGESCNFYFINTPFWINLRGSFWRLWTGLRDSSVGRCLVQTGGIIAYHYAHRTSALTLLTTSWRAGLIRLLLTTKPANSSVMLIQLET